MADPRTFTVKQCQAAYSEKSGAAIASATGKRRDFFNAVGKVGDLEVLNGVAGGKIGSGLRTLASISNTIRTGCGALPSSISSTLDAGANWVLEQTGLAPTVINTLQAFNPSVANQAYGQAKVIFDRVKNGRYKFKDIPGTMQDLINFERLARNIYTPGGDDAQSSLGERCTASPYAVDLIGRAPKYKFLFIIEFVPSAPYASLNDADRGPLNMAFVVKRTSRPNVKFVHSDVNYYNYRTKVATRTEFEDMSMTFHDDTQNHAVEFYRSYMRAMSPITGIENPDTALLEQSGMAFIDNSNLPNEVNNTIEANRYSASKGPLAGDVKQIFSEIRVYHVYDNGHMMNVHRFLNPKISSLSLDDLDMSQGSEGTEMSMIFNYDSVYIETVSVSTELNGGKYRLADLQRGAIYPLRYNAGADATEGPQQSSIQPGGQVTATSTGCDPLKTDTSNRPTGGLFGNTGNVFTPGGGFGGAIGQGVRQNVAAVTNLSSKFSKSVGDLFG